MQFTKIGDFLAASRITGPTHSLLQIKVGEGIQDVPICEILTLKNPCTHEPLDENMIVSEILNAVEDWNQRHGSKYVVTHIKYVQNDSKPETIYGFLASKIIEHLENGGEFVQGNLPNAL